MATYGGTVRRGLPRVSGGEAWPPAGAADPGAAEAGAVEPGAAGAAGVGSAAAPVAEPSAVSGAEDATSTYVTSHDSAGAVEPLGPGASEDEAGATGPGAEAGASARTAATAGAGIRRGLPRVAGGEPWPPARLAPAAAASPAAAPSSEVAALVASDAATPPDVPASVPEAGTGVAAAVISDAATRPDAPQAEGEAVAPSASATRPDVPPTAEGDTAPVRRGLPRTPGGEPWPPADFAPAPQAGVVVASAPATRQEPSSSAPAPEAEVVAAVASAAATGQDVSPSTGGGDTAPVRRGLPRTPGGDPWPPADFAPAPKAEVPAVAASAPATRQDAPPADPAANPGVAAAAASAPATRQEVPPAESAVAVKPARDLSQPLPFTRTVWPGEAARTRPERRPEPQRIGPFTKLQWLGAAIVGGGGLLVAAAMAVLAVRWLLSVPPLSDFVATYPGEYHLPETAPVGIPAWLGWQHFFNVFLIVLIIRSGWRIRNEKRPTAFWSPRSNGRRKMSLTMWFHQALDVLWVVNGLVFIALLVVTGHWMRIVPTSWEVFPNALSAALQYVSLDWPTENGWVNYNSLQQLAYFTTVFIAAPLAIVTGIRMSMWWPKTAPTLNKLYPVEWARRIHFPVMLYFVLFIIVHVALVFATGALRNLNHMYAAQGSVDPDAYAANWTGFWIFAVSMLVIVGGWVAARPLVIAPIARLFGSVSSR
ncbi:cytochrome b/b6 domain-containing protein [Microbacterium sp. Marseille-Q6648]|uniref:cytochrome b/b6 domain-containing protein n=1 Tax=Microbacterium sp. Marseille-Q6648 TaxID=2937991 RepID=UPI00203EA6F9|nr:cytochrome b/b6 domain-containing protein [Microbacterium sp. Marseille-Q6648]